MTSTIEVEPQTPTPLQELTHPLLEQKDIKLFIKRDDLIHPEIMGNKWRKLKYNLEEVRLKGLAKIVTFGGAHSNHIAATAAAGRVFGIQTVGIIRGDELTIRSNPTLEKAHRNGMELKFIDRSTYRKWKEDIPLEYLKDAYLLPEGGTNALAIRGAKEIVSEIDLPFHSICTAIGTGGTMCGLIDGVGSQKVIGISSLKGAFVEKEVDTLVKKYINGKKQYQVVADYHFGGYAKISDSLVEFINWFKETFRIQLDPVYTGKAMFGVWDMIRQGYFEPDQKIVFVHTGGLQGIEGFNRKSSIIIQ